MKKELTLFEASCIITGYGIGSGVLAMPYTSAKCGVWATAAIAILIAVFLIPIFHQSHRDTPLDPGEGCGFACRDSRLCGLFPDGRGESDVRV